MKRYFNQGGNVVQESMYPRGLVVPLFGDASSGVHVPARRSFFSFPPRLLFFCGKRDRMQALTGMHRIGVMHAEQVLGSCLQPLKNHD